MGEFSKMILDILYRAAAILALIYAVDAATDGKIDLPHMKLKLKWDRALKRLNKWLKRA